MSRAEDVLYLSLTDVDRLETLALVGLPIECVPTRLMRPVVTWAIEEFYRSGRRTAPTREALLESWGEVIDDARIELLPEDEDADTIEWAIDKLKAQYVWKQFEDFSREAVKAMSDSHELDRVSMLGAITDTLNELNMSLQSNQYHLTIQEGMTEALNKYEARADHGHVHRGMFFGMDEIDNHTNGIHPGEICVLAAPSKTGKSWFLNWCALKEWERGRVVVLYTLENSVEMVYDRMACMAEGIDYRSWQRGLCTEEEIQRVKDFINNKVMNPEMRGKMHVIMPDKGDRTVHSMVRKAKTLGCESLFIDQLTFVENPDAEKQRLARDQVIGGIMHDLKTLISTGAETMPVMVAHQVRREGVREARKNGYLQMDDMANGAEVERTADWVFGLHRSMVQREAGEAMLQILASRREDINNWDLNWEPSLGLISVARESEIEIS